MEDREAIKQTMIFVVFIIVVGLITAFLITEMVLHYESKKCKCVVNPQIEEQKQIYNSKVKEIIKQEIK